MENFFKRGFTVPYEAHVLFGLTESGQGKATGAYTLYPFLEKPHIIKPSDGNLLTRTIWKLADRTYRQNGTPSSRQSRYDARREEGIAEWKLRIANRELLRVLKESERPFVSMHGLFGYGADRTVVEIDRKVESMIAAPRTRALVPLPETADELREIGRQRGIKDQEIEVVGFLVPDVLKDEERKRRRQETLAQQAPTRDNPLRLAFMTTGQFAHQEIFTKHILGDKYVSDGIRNGTVSVDVYMWNSSEQAESIGHFVKDNLGLEATVNSEYAAHPSDVVQIFYNPDTQKAVECSMHMAAAADIVVSPIAERVGWTLEVPFIALPIVGSNRKMASNTEWVTSNGLAIPYDPRQTFGDVVRYYVGLRRGAAQRHAERAQEVKDAFKYGDLIGGAKRAAEIIQAAAYSNTAYSEINTKVLYKANTHPIYYKVDGQIHP
jgi:hypothetical protein